MPEPPEVLSLIVADNAYRDARSGKHVVAGTYSEIGAFKLPCLHPQMTVFFQITNLSAPVELKVRLERAHDGLVLIDVGGEFSSDDPLKVHARVLELRGIVFQESGKYWVQLVSGLEILTQVPLYVKLIETPPEQKSGGSDQ